MHQYSLEKLEYHKIKNIIAEYATTYPGKDKVQKLTPLTYEEVVERRLAEAKQGAKILQERGRPPLLCPEAIEKLLQRANKGLVLNISEINKIDKLLRSTGKTIKFFAELKEHAVQFRGLQEELLAGPLQQYKDHLLPQPELRNKIADIIDDNDEIKDDASPKLASLRNKISATENKVQNKINSIINDGKYTKMLQESLVTIRENRFVVPVKQQYRNTFKGIVHDQSASGMTVFMEPMVVVELNNKLRELRREEEAEIKRILTELTQEIAERSKEIKQNQGILSKFDEVFARSGYLQDNDGIIPQVNTRGYVEINQGRHPLLGQEAVPIDIFVGESFRLLLITGPNTGGKTVALKTLGLFVAMGLSGIPLPAQEGSEIAVFDNIFADIGDEQSIEQNLSTFSSHMNNIKEYLSKANKSSLVLLDEIGAGTDPEEGAALGISILEEFKRRQTVTVATTHYSQLKSYAYSTEGVENAAVEFDLETLSPTYKLIMGIPGGSNAFEIALRLGLPEKLISQARNLQDQDKLAVEDIIAELNQERKKYEELNKELKKKETKFSRKKEELRQEQEKLQKQQQNLIEETQEQAKKQLRQLKARAKKILGELKNKDFTQKSEVDRLESEINLEIKEMETKVNSLANKSDENQEKEEIDYDFKPGDQVRIESLNQRGEILEIHENNAEAEIQAGIMKVKADLGDLTPVEDEEQAKEQKLQKYKVEKSKKVSQSLDLRGMRYQEAQQELDKYLDDALLAGLRELEIIHGKGSGALRDAVSELIENHPHVKDYRRGREKEGGSGVTIVTIGS